MSEFRLVQTEKSYKVQADNFYLIQFMDQSFEPNKIEVAKLLKAQGKTALKITVVNQYKKLKRKGKKSKVIAQKRLKKYYVKLKVGEIIEETKEETL